MGVISEVLVGSEVFQCDNYNDLGEEVEEVLGIILIKRHPINHPLRSNIRTRFQVQLWTNRQKLLIHILNNQLNYLFIIYKNLSNENVHIKYKRYSRLGRNKQYFNFF